MSDYNKTEYNREYNKQAYKTVKVYIPVEEYDIIKDHYKANGYKAMSGYIKALIDADMKETEEKPGISVQHNKGVIIGDNSGTVNVGK